MRFQSRLIFYFIFFIILVIVFLIGRYSVPSSQVEIVRVHTPQARQPIESTAKATSSTNIANEPPLIDRTITTHNTHIVPDYLLTTNPNEAVVAEVAAAPRARLQPRTIPNVDSIIQSPVEQTLSQASSSIPEADVPVSALAETVHRSTKQSDRASSGSSGHLYTLLSLLMIINE